MLDKAWKFQLPSKYKVNQVEQIDDTEDEDGSYYQMMNSELQEILNKYKSVVNYTFDIYHYKVEDEKEVQTWFYVWEVRIYIKEAMYIADLLRGTEKLDLALNRFYYDCEPEYEPQEITKYNTKFILT